VKSQVRSSKVEWSQIIQYKGFKRSIGSILFLEPPRDGLAGRDGLRAGLMAGSFTVVKRNAFATGRERVSSCLVLEDLVGARA
jgi:hypothetical protein